MTFKQKLAIMPMVGALVLLLTFGLLYAAELSVTGPITDVVELTDSNGNPYTRLIVEFDRQMNGEAYKVGLPVMAFGKTLADQAAALAIGDNLNAICQRRIYNERESFTIIKMLE